MGMTVAELFVNLGIKGAPKVKEALGGTVGELQRTKQMSLEAKAGIIGAVYGLERLTAGAVQSAVDLTKFAGATGLSTAALQQWQFIAEQNNVKGEELAGTVKNLQMAQAQMSLHGRAPQGFTWFGLDPTDNTLTMLEKIRKKIAEVRGRPEDIAIARYMASTLGISDDLYAMMRTGTMSLRGYHRELQLTGDEQKRLVGLGREWTKLWAYTRGKTQKVLADKDVTEMIKFTVAGLSKGVDYLATAVHGWALGLKQIRSELKRENETWGHWAKRESSEGMNTLRFMLGLPVGDIPEGTRGRSAAPAGAGGWFQSLLGYFSGGAGTGTGAPGEPGVLTPAQEAIQRATVIGALLNLMGGMTSPAPGLTGKEGGGVRIEQHFHNVKERDMPAEAGRQTAAAANRLSGNR